MSVTWTRRHKTPHMIGKRSEALIQGWAQKCIIIHNCPIKFYEGVH
uniref:Uncharacterized protein n=1 Tax=Anguilla anguilla TaxID=7936 RepID=A0A0E9PB02_ANGAN